MDFPGCTVVETPHFNAGAVGSIPGGGLGERGVRSYMPHCGSQEIIKIKMGSES